MKYKKVKILDAMRSVVDWMDGVCVSDVIETNGLIAYKKHLFNIMSSQ